MRKHFYKFAAVWAALLLFCQSSMVAFGAAKRQEIDTITLENEAADEDVAVDLAWKTEQDKGQWIEDMGFAGDAKSLVLVINNLDGAEEDPIQEASIEKEKVRPRRTQVAGNSRLYYMSKDANGDWKQVFSINCMISGGSEENSSIYGAYRVDSAFGIMENPGSLVPYQEIHDNDYLITDSNSEDYMKIVSAVSKTLVVDNAVQLENMKAFSNYGMILRLEEDEAPSIVINCQQADTLDRTFGGIQLSESYVRMLIQSIDEDTRILIAGDVEDLEGM